jgi:serine/threonine protein kinase
MDCATCYYPNEAEARFCVRCAAALGVAVSSLPTEAPAAPSPAVADLIAGSGDLGAPHALAQALQGGAASRGGGRGELGFGAASAQAALLGGRYRLLTCLGSGGFGAVYEAEEVSLGLRVAIKLLNRTALQDARMRQRFLQEARMIAELRSPHVVMLHDYAVTEHGVPYLVMELLAGKPLSHDMLSGPFCQRDGQPTSWRRSVEPWETRTLAEWFIATSSRTTSCCWRTLRRWCTVRRFLATPGADRDFVKVVDFGVARWCGVSTRASDILGTPAYISPETLADEPVDGRSDLYAVGMLLWQMIVGELPFPGKNQALMMKSHLDAPRLRPREINPRYRLPDELEDLMVQLVARAPSDRPSSAYAVRAPCSMSCWRDRGCCRTGH